MNRTRSGSYTCQAIVLRTRNLGEQDRVMTLLSAEGKFCAVAKGGRAMRSKLAAISQPFVYARFLIAPGRNLDIASQATVEVAFPHITGDLLKTAWASYLCELCDQMPEHQPEPELFDLLRSALCALDVGQTRLETILIGSWFESRFLVILGYTPIIGHCVANGEKIVVAPGEQSVQVSFSAGLGGTLCSACAARDSNCILVSSGALRAIHFLMRANDPPASSRIDLPAAGWRDLRRCLRAQLRFHLETRLKSQRFLDEVMENVI